MQKNDELHAPPAFSAGKDHPVPIGYEVEWAQEPVWILWRRDEFLALLGIKPQSYSPQPVSIPTELSRLFIT
jgi:hypothetical protein